MYGLLSDESYRGKCMKVLVIGSGLGGLLSAAWLSRAGHEVDVFERLPITGGRFTNIQYKGFQLSTGALHMIPHGPTGPLGTLLKDVGADVQIVRADPMAIIRIPIEKDATDYAHGFRDIDFHDFRKRFSLLNRLNLQSHNYHTYFSSKKRFNGSVVLKEPKTGLGFKACRFFLWLGTKPQS
jgi:monoamine oxidase